jgi:hypothetical protein
MHMAYAGSFEKAATEHAQAYEQAQPPLQLKGLG